jgi:hypothetical protein
MACGPATSQWCCAVVASSPARGSKTTLGLAAPLAPPRDQRTHAGAVRSAHLMIRFMWTWLDLLSGRSKCPATSLGTVVRSSVYCFCFFFCVQPL